MAELTISERNCFPPSVSYLARIIRRYSKSCRWAHVGIAPNVAGHRINRRAHPRRDAIYSRREITSNDDTEQRGNE
jgi:hypothetical protein